MCLNTVNDKRCCNFNSMKEEFDVLQFQYRKRQVLLQQLEFSLARKNIKCFNTVNGKHCCNSDYFYKEAIIMAKFQYRKRSSCAPIKAKKPTNIDKYWW